MSAKEIQKPFEIGGEVIQPGTMRTVRIPLTLLPDHSSSELEVRVIHGKTPGKTLFVSSTIHGDELNGIEAIRRVLASPALENMKGTLVVVPIVNIFGMLIKSRYLPDRRDLNRSFPGSEKGSAAAQLAHTFLKEVVEKCTHGVDLHTGSGNRTNLPQLRCDLQSEEAVKMAVAFGVPVLLKARLREGSLREASEKIGIPTITFEGGEALRWTELSIKAAAEGVLRVMEFLDMISLKGGLSEAQKPVISPYSRWLRAPITGMFRSTNELGDEIFKGDVIGKISDPLGEKTTDVKSSLNGIIVGKTQDPVVYKGDALFNVAWVPDPTKAEESIEEIEEKEMSLCVDDPESY